MKTRRRKRIGSCWRILANQRDGSRVDLQSDGESVFDELVIDGFLHIEQMDTGFWWARIGDARLEIVVEKGDVTVNVERGAYGERRGGTIS